MKTKQKSRSVLLAILLVIAVLTSQVFTLTLFASSPADRAEPMPAAEETAETGTSEEDVAPTDEDGPTPTEEHELTIEETFAEVAQEGEPAVTDSAANNTAEEDDVASETLEQGEETDNAEEDKPKSEDMLAETTDTAPKEVRS